jgi:hypothetical protein
MNRFLILGTNIVEGYDQYKGTYRTSPYYVEEFPEESEINQLFLWYIGTDEELEIISDIEKAKKIVELYKNLTPPQIFDVVRVLEVNEPLPENEEFLGYDLSCGYYSSLLSWGLDIDNEGEEEDRLLKQISPLISLVKKHFKPLLNKNSLFDDSETAKFCLECLMALQDIVPGIFENEEVIFEVIGLSKVC